MSQRWLTSSRSVTFRLHSITFWTTHHVLDDSSISLGPTKRCHVHVTLVRQSSTVTRASYKTPIESEDLEDFVHTIVISYVLLRSERPSRKTGLWFLHSYTFWTTLSYFSFDFLHSLTFLLGSYCRWWVLMNSDSTKLQTASHKRSCANKNQYFFQLFSF